MSILETWRKLLGAEIAREPAVVVSVAGERVTVATRSGAVAVLSPVASRYRPGDRVTLQAGQIVGRASGATTTHIV